MRGILPNNGNDSVQTVNAAAHAIVSAGQRVQQDTVPKRRWNCLSVYWCFGFQKQPNRIGHAVLLPELPSSENGVPTADGHPQVPTPMFPFVAPPSSPASFLQSEPPSATQSPAGFLSLCSFSSSNAYSPGGPSIFDIGPYAHETQLVSPPVFSTLTTEPSTAPFTPPPESVHVTTPSSPEVPFAKLVSSALDSKQKADDKGLTFTLPFTPVPISEFQTYQLYPGSPIGNLISPGSAISGSGTSSPFPDVEFSSSTLLPMAASAVLSQNIGPTKLCSTDGSLSTWKSIEKQHPGLGLPEPLSNILAKELRPDDQIHNAFVKQIPDMVYIGDLHDKSMNRQLVDDRLSFHLPTEEVASRHSLNFGFAEGLGGCMPESPVLMAVSRKLSSEAFASRSDLGLDEHALGSKHWCSSMTANSEVACVTSEGNSSDGNEAVDVASVKEFKFDNIDNTDEPTTITSSEWWTNEKSVAKAGSEKWAFFSVMQPGIS